MKVFAYGGENPGSKLIFTGGVSKTNTVSTAEVGARVAQSLGVPHEQIITLDLPKDTEEEAAAVKQAIGDAPFLLVTSASHLPRAMIFSAGRVKSATSPGESVGHRLAA